MSVTFCERAHEQLSAVGTLRGCLFSGELSQEAPVSKMDISSLRYPLNQNHK